jgi:Peptidase propeptide and YPEB domain
MFKSIAAKQFRNIALATVALSVMGGAAPSFAGGYGDPDIIYADQFDGGPEMTGEQLYPSRREHPRPAPVIEDDDTLSARQIVRVLRRQGYGQIQEISLRGDTYRVMAIRNNGALVKLRVDAFSGEILSARRVGWINAPVRPMPRRHGDSGVTIEFGFGSAY